MIRILGALLLAAASGCWAAPFAYFGKSHGITVVDVATHQVAGEWALGMPVSYVRFSGTAERAFARMADGTVMILDTQARQPVGRLPTYVQDFVVSPSAPILYGVHRTQLHEGPPGPTFSVHSTSTGELIRSFRMYGGMDDMAFTPSGEHIVIVGGLAVHLLEAASSRVLASIPLPQSNVAAKVAVHPDGRSVYVFDNSTMRVLALPSFMEVASIPVGGFSSHVAMHPQGTRLYASSYYEGNLRVIDTATRSVVATIPACPQAWAVDVTPDGSSVYLVCAGRIEVYSTATHARIATVPVSGGATGAFIGPTSSSASAAPGPATGLWWNPAESGWGVHLTQRRDTVFAAWFTYDATGLPKWYVASSCTMDRQLSCPTCLEDSFCSGELYETTYNGRYFSDRFEPGTVQLRNVGVVQIFFRDKDNARMSYAVGGRTRTVPISRQPIRPSPGVPAIDYTDLWWNPAEPGWGLGVSQQGDVMFLTWFAYDDSARHTWLIASNCAVEADGKGCVGEIYRTSGPPGPSASDTFDPPRVRATRVGTAELSFGDANNGVLRYTVDGISGTKAITRQLF